MTRLLARLWGRSLNGGSGNGNHAFRYQGPSRTTGRMRRSRYVLTAAEIAPCTCPDFCERDHGND